MEITTCGFYNRKSHLSVFLAEFYQAFAESTVSRAYQISNSVLLVFVFAVCYDVPKEMIIMDTKDILLQLRTRNGLSQEQLAEQVFVTRQAVSRWETGGSLR